MGRMVRTAAACVVGMAMAGSAAAQARPTPGPEVQRLATMVGSWQDESTAPATKFGPGGKEKGTSSCEWFTGNFQLVCRGESTGAQGTKNATMFVLGWHPGRKLYLAQIIDSTGMVSQMTGTVTGNTWTFTTDEIPPPMPMPGVTTGKFRMTIVEVSPTEQKAKGELSINGGPWTLMMEGTSTKTK